LRAPLNGSLGIHVQVFEAREAFPRSREIAEKHLFQMLAIVVHAFEYSVLAQQIEKLLSPDCNMTTGGVHDGETERKREISEHIPELVVRLVRLVIQNRLDLDLEVGLFRQKSQPR